MKSKPDAEVVQLPVKPAIEDWHFPIPPEGLRLGVPELYEDWQYRPSSPR